MKKKFNLSAYKKLLELLENGKISCLDERHLELLEYEASVEVQIIYNIKEDFFLLIEKYLSCAIAPHEFRSKFLEMEKEASRTANIIRIDFRELENLTLSENIDKFSSLMARISNLCFDFYEMWNENMKPMSEAEFRSLVNNSYLQLQEAFPFKNFNNQTYKHLISGSFKFLVFTIGLGIIIVNFK